MSSAVPALHFLPCTVSLDENLQFNSFKFHLLTIFIYSVLAYKLQVHNFESKSVHGIPEMADKTTMRKSI